MIKSGGKSKSSPYLKRIVISAALLAITGAVVLAARAFPEAVELVYMPVCAAAMGVLSAFSSVFPFSLAEMLLYLACAGLLIYIVYMVYALIKKPERLKRLAGLASAVLLIVSSGLFAFYILWGIGYQRPEAAVRMGLDVRERPAKELYSVTLALIRKANSLAPEARAAGAVSSDEFVRLAEKTAASVSRKTGKKTAVPKGIAASVPFSYTQTTGIFIPFTGEANVNKNNVAPALPFVMAHEISHREGIAREDEANFQAFLYLWDCGDKELEYSAYFSALLYCLEQIHIADEELWTKVWPEMGAPLRADLSAYVSHWKSYRGKIGEKAQQINDTYLRIQGQDDGVQSYGRMVDLLLALLAIGQG